MICVQCLCWFKSVFRFRWILGFLKNRWVSGHMRWGIAFRPRWKSPPFGMFQYFQMHILVSKIQNLGQALTLQPMLGYPAAEPTAPVLSGFAFTNPLILHGFQCYSYMSSWLVVGPPLWKIWKSIGMISNPIYGKIKNGNQTTNQVTCFLFKRGS